MILRPPTRSFFTVVGVLLAVVLWCSVAAACPNCSDGLSEQTDGGDWVAGYFWSILFMMAMPFTIFTAIGGYMYREVRKARSVKERDDQSDRTAS